MKVAVIGAGWAGLAAAVKLAGAGIDTRVFEASRQAGGRARRVTLEGIDLDNGQHILIGAYRATLEAMRACGARPESLLQRLPLQLRYVDGFRLHAPRLPYPLNLGAAFLTARGLGLAEARTAAPFVAALKAPDFRVHPDRSVARWLREQGQEGALRDHLWEPLCLSALNTPLDSASAQVFASVLRSALTGSRANSDLLLPATDLGRLFPDPAAAFIRARGSALEFGAGVRRISRRDGRFALDERPEAFDAVVVATAPQHAGALLEGFPELAAQRSQLSAFAYEPITTCYLQYAATVRLPSAMLGLRTGMLQWAFDRGRLGGPAGLIAAVISASGAHAGLSNDELGAIAHRELAAQLPPYVSKLRSTQLLELRAPAWTRVITEQRATFSCRPALERPTSATPVRGLVLAGDYLEPELPGTLESAARAGLRAAGLIIGAPSRAR